MSSIWLIGHKFLTIWIASAYLSGHIVHFLSTKSHHYHRVVSIPRTNRILELSIIASSIDFVSTLDEWHDLDYDDEMDTSEQRNDEENEPSSDQQHNKRIYGKSKPNFIERFSHAMASEIIRRLPHVQFPFQFQPPWRDMSVNRKQNNKHCNKAAANSPNLLKGKAFDDDDDNDKGSYNGNKILQTKSIDIQSERRALTCPPENTGESADSDKEVDNVDKSVALCPPTLSEDNTESTDESCNTIEENNADTNNVNINDVQAGMVVYVFPQGKSVEHKSVSSEVSTSEGATSLERIESSEHDEDAQENTDSNIHAKRCIIEMGEQYDNDEQVVQYTLLEQEPVELGNVDVHRKDFAYQPVVLTIDGTGFGESSGHSPAVYKGVETRITPEDEAVATMFASLPTPQQQPSWDGASDDQQVSFRWWSWVSHFMHRDSGGNSEETILTPDIVISDSSEGHSYQYNGQQSSYQGNIYEEDGSRPFAGGSHGEIWRARRRCPMNGKAGDSSNETKASFCDDGKDLIVKRLKIEYGYPILEAGLREVYFGELLGREAESSNMFTTYVDHFFREGAQNQVELWIVFENAGPSLRSFLYTQVDSGDLGFMVFQHSAFWRRLRRGISGGRRRNEDESLVSAASISHADHYQPPDQKRKGHDEDAPEGRQLLKEVLRQLITAAAMLHERGIVHRDIKPSNIMCKTSPPTEDGVIPSKIDMIQCLLGDFSSSWNDFTARNLYSNGPTAKEQTDEYAPPEVLFQGTSWAPFSRDNPFSYDSWSIGVVALEMLLGSPNVWTVDQRTTALLTNRLKKEGATSYDIQRALYLAALSQFCIYVPTTTESEEKDWPLRRGDPLHNVKPVKNKCTLNDFHNALRARDPLGLGFNENSNTLLHLVWSLLHWDPTKRLSAVDALKHPYFSFSSESSSQDWNPVFLHTKLFDTRIIIPGAHNALEHQTLDPRVDMGSSGGAITEFVCPKCNKTFSDHNSCQRHARSRRHAHFCTYDRSKLPQCLNAHSMLPSHDTSGYCDIQGRRKTIEDFHTVHLSRTHQFYGMFDGHLGNLASKYAASSFYSTVEDVFLSVDKNIQSSQPKWKEDATSNLVHSFEDLHNGIIDAITSNQGVMDESGTTVTILYISDFSLVVANVGDSRAIMSTWSTEEAGHQRISAHILTIDHVASLESEQLDIIARGGFISKSGGIDRVNGNLAVSRSLGDIKLAPFLSRVPHVLALTNEEAHAICRDTPTIAGQSLPCFVILASDGLWDVMDNQEAVELAFQVINGNESGTAYQEAAEVLTQEAYVRGSLDNIGVCVVAII